MREHEPAQPGEAPATGGREVHTDAFVKQIAIAERAMVKSLNSGQRIEEIMSGAQVSKRRARRLIRAVNKLWHYRALAFGTPSRSRVKILPMVTDLYEAARASGDLKAALGSLKLFAELCGLTGHDALGLPLGDETPPAKVDERAEEVAQVVMDRLMAFGLNGRGSGHSLAPGGNGSERGQA